MKDYSPERLRNVCLMGHGGSGKTMLAEAMLFNTGVLDRFGKILDGTTTTDFDPEEIKRKFSINTAVAPFEWNDCKLNIIDTPGYFDFVGEVRQAIRVSEGAVIVVPAKGGVAVGTEKAWAYANEQDIPKLFFVSKMDEENADFMEVLDQLSAIFGNTVTAFQLPIMVKGTFGGYVDTVNLVAKTFDGDKTVDAQIPADLQDIAENAHEKLIEAIAETGEELMEKFFAGEEFTPEDISKGLKTGLSTGSIVPVFCGSAMNNSGIREVMDALVSYMPSPAEKPVAGAVKAGTDKAVEVKPVKDAPFSALVFKTIADPFVGKISIFRVYSGTMKSDSTVYNSHAGKTEKAAQVYVLRGKKQLPVDMLVAGDIGAVAKLQYTSTNDTLCDQSNAVELRKIEFPEPAMSLAVEPKTKGDEEKIGSVLQRLQDEDPTFKVSINAETKQMLISGVGEQHLDVVVSKLKSKFGVSVNLIDPKVPYRETIKKKVKAEGKHKKQSGGHGQYGHVFIEFEPGHGAGAGAGAGGAEDLIFEEKVFGGSVPRQYFPAVEKGLREAIVKGVLAGYPVVNLKATLVDGSYHPVDSSEMAFKIAARLAYRKGLAEASPILLEPIARVEVYIPDSYMGDIIGDLNKRRGRILGMNPQDGGLQQVVAEVPQSEMFKYATDLRSMTQGRGYFKLWFERYEETPAMVSQKVIEEAKKGLAEEDDEE